MSLGTPTRLGRTDVRELLLDTHAFIWLIQGVRLDDRALPKVRAALTAGMLFVSPVSAWEIGMLCSPRGSQPPRLRLSPDAKSWYLDALRLPGLREAPLTSTAALDAVTLPGELHRDPADRLLVATARERGAALVTSDGALIAYANAGHLDVLPC